MLLLYILIFNILQLYNLVKQGFHEYFLYSHTFFLFLNYTHFLKIDFKCVCVRTLYMWGNCSITELHSQPERYNPIQDLPTSCVPLWLPSQSGYPLGQTILY